jgi:hypothetical protein
MKNENGVSGKRGVDQLVYTTLWKGDQDFWMLGEKIYFFEIASRPP